MKEKTIEKRRKEIFEAALKVFSKKSFNKATLDEIADKVKISKPAIYLYFKNKENLFFSMIDDKMNLSNKKVDYIIKMKINSIDKLRQIVAGNIKFFINNKDFFKVIHQIKFQMDSDKKSKMHNNFISKYKNYINKIVKLIKQCIHDGYLKNQDPIFLTFSLIGMVNQNFFRCMLNNEISSLKGVADKIFELFLKGAGK